MDTIYNVGDTVFIEAKVEEIHVDKRGIRYMCAFNSAYDGTYRPAVGPEILRNKLHAIKEDSANA